MLAVGRSMGTIEMRSGQVVRAGGCDGDGDGSIGAVDGNVVVLLAAMRPWCTGDEGRDVGLTGWLVVAGLWLVVVSVGDLPLD